jgi:ABC-type branched-subunit amino acid transport system ATPase component
VRLRASGISKHFGGLAAVDDFTVSLHDSEVLGLAGPNGAGKSTVVDLLSGHARCDHGRVWLGERDVTTLRAHQRARLGIARTFQSPLVPAELKVSQVLHAARSAWRPHVSDEELAAVSRIGGLESEGDRLAGSLETLARRKLLLACLLVRDPRVLLLDEPCSGLLAEEINEMEEIVGRLRAAGTAILIVEHRLELLAAVADRVLVMDYGKVIAEGTATEVFNAPAVQEAYFGAAVAAA